MISVAGTLVADLLVRPIRNWQGKGHNANVDCIELLPGGTVANTGFALARLGVPVSALAAVGDDSFGSVVKESINRWATRNRVVVIPSIPTTASVVAVFEDGDRCFLSTRGACERFELTPADVISEIEAGSRALHVGYAGRLPALDGEPMKNLLRFARERGALTSLDVTYFPDNHWPDMMSLMPDLDLFCPNLIEATAITGRNSASEAAAALVEAGVQKFVAVTDGPNGALVHVVGDGQEHVPARPVKVVDTTGAGDAFIAGVLASWYRGCSWWTAAQVGILVASTAVTSAARFENLPSFEELTHRTGKPNGEP
jgi:sugar/nucleoside kinase (ribokinase family)